MDRAFDNPVIKEFPRHLPTYCGSGTSCCNTENECPSSNNYLPYYQQQFRGNRSMCVTEAIDNDLQLVFDMDSNIVDLIDGSITTPTDPKVCGLPPITGGLVQF